MPRVRLEEVTSPASAQSVAKSAVFPQNWATLTLLPPGPDLRTGILGTCLCSLVQGGPKPNEEI